MEGVSGKTIDEVTHVAWRRWLVIAMLAVLIRGGVIWLRGDGLRADPDAYRLVAENVVRRGTFSLTPSDDPEVKPTAFRPPLYPLVLAAVSWHGRVEPLVVGVLHLFLGVFAVLLTVRLAERNGAHRLASTLAGVAVAVDPILVNQSTLVMTETLATLLAVAALCGLNWLEDRPSNRRALAAGLLLGIATLCRPTFAAWAALVMAVWLVRRWRIACGLAFAVAISLLPWTLRNWFAFGQPIATTTHGGYTLLLGNNPDIYRYLRDDASGLPWCSTMLDREWAATANLDEPARDRLARERALENIRRGPTAFAWSCLRRIGWFWGVLPQRLATDEPTGTRWLRYATAGWYVPVFTAAIIGLVRLGRSVTRTPWLWGLLLCLSFTAVHAMYWSNLRMRAPLMPWLYVLAASGFRSYYPDEPDRPTGANP